MIDLDTNVLVRYIAQDDAQQSPRASKLFSELSVENPGFVTIVALVELVWVMQSCYEASKAEVVTILKMLCRTRELSIENSDTAIAAVSIFEGSKADFADCMVERSAHKAGCRYTVTFDKAAAKFGGMQLLA
jgi:predicted nucleic-acid-binding protein